MEVIHSVDISEEMKDNIQRIIKDSFKQKNLDKHIYIARKLKELYYNKYWNVFYIYRGKHNGYFFNTYGPCFVCKYKNYVIIIYPKKKNKKISKDNSEEEEEKENHVEKLEDDIKSLKQEKNDINVKLTESENIIKNYKYLIDELKLKLDLKSNELESLKEKIKENNQNDIKEKNQFNQTFYTRDQMLALNL